MRAGAMDRLITIEQPADSVATSGRPVTTWSTFAQVWAGKSESRGREYFAARQVVVAKAAEFRIHYLDGVTAKMRITDDAGQVWNVRSTVEVGRREGLLIYVEGLEE